MTPVPITANRLYFAEDVVPGCTEFSEGINALDLNGNIVWCKSFSGISRPVAERLLHAGISVVDAAGSGGTSWARIEGERAHDTGLGELFADWGIPTLIAIRRLRDVPGLTVIGSGGVRHGIDVAKAIAAGADLVGMAYRFLQAADQSAEAAEEKVRSVVEELRMSMFCVGAGTLAGLRDIPLYPARSGLD